MLLLTGAAPDLKPERATTWSGTVEFKPRLVAGLDVKATYFNIDYRDRLASPFTSVLSALYNPIYDDFIAYDPSAAEVNALIATVPGGLVNETGAPFDPAGVGAIVDTSLRNSERQRIHGIDIDADYRIELGRSGTLRLSGSASHLVSAQQLSAGQPFLPLAGTIFHPPHWRGRAGHDVGRPRQEPFGIRQLCRLQHGRRACGPARGQRVHDARPHRHLAQRSSDRTAPQRGAATGGVEHPQPKATRHPHRLSFRSALRFHQREPGRTLPWRLASKGLVMRRILLGCACAAALVPSPLMRVRLRVPSAVRSFRPSGCRRASSRSRPMTWSGCGTSARPSRILFLGPPSRSRPTGVRRHSSFARAIPDERLLPGDGDRRSCRGQMRPRIVDEGGESILPTIDLRGIAALPSGLPRVITPRWSADGKWFAFLKRSGQTTQVWRAFADGSGSALFTHAATDVVDFRIGRMARASFTQRAPGSSARAQRTNKRALTGGIMTIGSFPCCPRDPSCRADRARSRSSMSGVGRSRSAARGSCARRGRPRDHRGRGRADPPRSPDSRSRRPTSPAEPSPEHFGPIADRTTASCTARRARAPRPWWRRGRPTSGSSAAKAGRTPQPQSMTGTLKNGGFTGSTSPKTCFRAVRPMAIAVCLVDSSLKPRKLVRLDPATGERKILFDPNPEFARSCLASRTAALAKLLRDRDGRRSCTSGRLPGRPALSDGHRPI